MHVEVVTIGDELLLGFTIDTNAAFLARELASIGVQIDRRTTVGDSAGDIASAVGDALDRSGAVITTGGLGPTSDDLTKQSIAALFGRGLHLDEEHQTWMEQRWLTRFQRPLPASNRAQAMIPDGARKLVNRHGSAPGIWIDDDRGRWVAMLPGVPREMRGMVLDTILPALRDRMPTSAVIRSRTLRTTGIAESLLADRIDTGVSALGDVSLAYLPSADGVDLRVTARGLPGDQAEAVLTAAAESLRRLVGDVVYGEDDSDLAKVVLDLCRQRSLTLSVAESCTGGLVGARLTAVPGSSDVVLGGVIAYHNRLKMELLGVAEGDLERHGAVSEPVVRQMARGTRLRTGATLGVAVTGVAGPGGGTPEKPVGTVWIAVDQEGGARAAKLLLVGDRDEIRRRSAQGALELVRREIGSR